MVVRRSIFALLLVSVIAVTAAGATSAETMLDLGMRAFRAGDYASAAVDLQNASDTLLAPDLLQSYVETGRLDQLQPFETALVYLALAQFRLQREDDARDTVVRLLAAERFSPTYANLPLQAEAADFETLAAALVPSSNLPANVQMAAVDPSMPLPPVRPLAETVTLGTAIGRPERQALVDSFTSAERERIQRQAAAAQAVAAAHAVPPPALAPPVLPAAPPPVQTVSVEEKVPAPETVLDSPSSSAVPAGADPAPFTVLQPEVKTTEPQPQPRTEIPQAVPEPAPVPEPTTVPEPVLVPAAPIQPEPHVELPAEPQVQPWVSSAPADPERRVLTMPSGMPSGGSSSGAVYLTTLRQAEALADNGYAAEANRIYTGLAISDGVPREVVAEAAVGLYRTGAYRDAVQAFRRMGAFARGEEDLRYYNAVALYESGDYQAAQKELACALPFIEVSDDVARYRTKIEMSSIAEKSARNQ